MGQLRNAARLPAPVRSISTRDRTGGCEQFRPSTGLAANASSSSHHVFLRMSQFYRYGHWRGRPSRGGHRGDAFLQLGCKERFPMAARSARISTTPDRSARPVGSNRSTHERSSTQLTSVAAPKHSTMIPGSIRDGRLPGANDPHNRVGIDCKSPYRSLEYISAYYGYPIHDRAKK